MVTYSTNWMGVVSTRWYEERGLDHKQVQYCCGRIDIRDDSKEGYDGQDEYSVAPMTAESWNILSDWLWDLETEEVVGYYRLIEMFEQQTRHKIEWVKKESE